MTSVPGEHGAMSGSPFEVAMIPIGDLIPHERNPQIGDVGAVATAIATDGFHLAVLARSPQGKRKSPQIIAGHTRWRALSALQRDGYTAPDGSHLTYAELAERVPLPPDGFVPVQIQPMDDARAVRKLIADNRASTLASTDDAVLIELLGELATNDDLFGSLFDGDDLDDLIVQVNADVSPEVGFGPRHDPSEVTCPSCGEKFVLNAAD